MKPARAVHLYLQPLWASEWLKRSKSAIPSFSLETRSDFLCLISRGGALIGHEVPLAMGTIMWVGAKPRAQNQSAPSRLQLRVEWTRALLAAFFPQKKAVSVHMTIITI